MITNYNKFNINEKSIYTEQDINQILDKGFKNFDESDFAVLMSYATDDKDIKDIINKIKSYREPFETLNVLIKNETDKNKQQIFFRRWLKLHEELSELENMLRFKYKIDNPQKIKKLEERLNINDKYQYNCLIIKIDNEDEASIIYEIISDFCDNNKIDSTRLRDFFNHMQEIEEPIYIRLRMDSDDLLVVTWGKISKLDYNQSDQGYTYERVFNLEDLEKGLLDNIKKYGKSNPIPTYKPRKLIKESFDYNRYEIYKDELMNHIRWIYVRTNNNHQIRSFYQAMLKSDKISDLTNKSIMDDWIENPTQGNSLYFGFRYDNYAEKFEVSLLIYDTNGQKTYPQWMLDYEDTEIIKRLFGINLAPSYKPRKIDRTLEHYDIPKYHIKTEDEFLEEFGDNWKDEVALVWVDGMNQFFGKLMDIEVYEEDKVRGKNKVLFHIGGYNFSWDMITYNKPKVPNYRPRKIDKTLESNTWYPYRFKTEQEFIKEYGNNWKDRINWNDENEMDYLFGVDFIYPYDKVPGRFDFGPQNYNTDQDYHWHIDKNMLIENKPQIPSYKPRKIYRTLESKNFIEYRFKTKEEFEREYGVTWRTAASPDYIWVNEMDGLLGQPLPKPFPDDEEDIVVNVNGRTSYWVDRNFITNKGLTPSYKPRKINRDI